MRRLLGLLLLIIPLLGATGPRVTFPPGFGTATLPENLMTYDEGTGVMDEPATRLPYPEISVGTPAGLCDNVRHWFQDTSVTTYPRLCLCAEAGQPPLCLDLAYPSQTCDGSGVCKTWTGIDGNLNLPDGNGIAFDAGATGNVITQTPKLKFPSEARGDLPKRGAAVWERLALGASGTILTSNGTDPVWSTPAVDGNRLLNLNTSQVVVANTGTETNVVSYTVPGGTLGTGNCIQVTVGGDHLKNATCGIIYRLGYGGTQIASPLISWGSQATRRGFAFTGHVCANASASAQKMWFGLSYSVTSTANAYGTASIASASDQTLTVSFDWDTNDINCDATKEVSRVDLITP